MAQCLTVLANDTSFVHDPEKPVVVPGQYALAAIDGSNAVSACVASSRPSADRATTSYRSQTTWQPATNKSSSMIVDLGVVRNISAFHFNWQSSTLGLSLRSKYEADDFFLRQTLLSPTPCTEELTLPRSNPSPPATSPFPRLTTQQRPTASRWLLAISPMSSFPALLLPDTSSLLLRGVTWRMAMEVSWPSLLCCEVRRPSDISRIAARKSRRSLASEEGRKSREKTLYIVII